MRTGSGWPAKVIAGIVVGFDLIHLAGLEAV
jgi:hypothetical protein